MERGYFAGMQGQKAVAMIGDIIMRISSSEIY